MERNGRQLHLIINRTGTNRDEGRFYVENRQVKRALLSVTDKTGLVDFARELNGLHVELISTGGTARALREAGLTVRDVSDLTGFPEMLDGRVKTLHPKVHGGILHMRSSAEHTAAVAEQGIEPIDMVVVNLYAFEKVAAKKGVPLEVVSKRLGHAGIRITAERYLHVYRESDAAAAGVLDTVPV